MRRLLAFTILLVGLAACSSAEESVATSPPASSTTTSTATTIVSTTTTTLPDFAVTSPAFADGTAIPVEHTCDGQDVSPELDVVGLPAATQSIAVTVDDPDAPLGIWYHWVEFDIIADTGSYELVRGTPLLGVPGVNSWNLEGYLGPCPPPGEEHRYVFRIYALSSTLDLPAGVNAAEVLASLGSNVIDSVELTGVYSRQSNN